MKRRKSQFARPWAVALSLCALLVGSWPRSAAAADSQQDPIPIAVLPLGLTAETHQRYPQLAESNVGFGIHNILVNRLYDSGRFRLVEDKPEVIDDLIHRQWVSSSGAVDPESAVRHGRILGARYVLYGEVYDFSTRRLRRKRWETRIAVQLRIVDVETTEYVPASGTGVVLHQGKVFPRKDLVAFARSTIGRAGETALKEAVAQLLERFKGWQLRNSAASTAITGPDGLFPSPEVCSGDHKTITFFSE